MDIVKKFSNKCHFSNLVMWDTEKIQKIFYIKNEFIFHQIKMTFYSKYTYINNIERLYSDVRK